LRTGHRISLAFWLQNGQALSGEGARSAVAPRATLSKPVTNTHQAAKRNTRRLVARLTSDIPQPNRIMAGAVPAPNAAMQTSPAGIVPVAAAKAT